MNLAIGSTMEYAIVAIALALLGTFLFGRLRRATRASAADEQDAIRKAEERIRSLERENDV